MWHQQLLRLINLKERDKTMKVDSIKYYQKAKDILERLGVKKLGFLEN